jgi:hypothetical protein
MKNAKVKLKINGWIGHILHFNADFIDNKKEYYARFKRDENHTYAGRTVKGNEIELI